MLSHRFGIDLRKDFLHGLTGDAVGSIGLLEDLARNFTLPETREADAAREPPEGALLCGGKLLARNSDVELHLRGCEPGKGGGSQIKKILERKTRFELATLALARRCSTTELLPRVFWRPRGLFGQAESRTR